MQEQSGQGETGLSEKQGTQCLPSLAFNNGKAITRTSLIDDVPGHGMIKKAAPEDGLCSLEPCQGSHSWTITW
jgi:hypothetical protein